MKFNELVLETKNIDLEKLGVFLGRKANRLESISCWEENGIWIFQKVDGRQNVIEERGTEEEIVELMSGYIELWT